MTERTSSIDFDEWRLIDRDGAWIGDVEQLCGVECGDGLEWAVVSTGVLGLRRIVVPLHGATLAGPAVQVPIALDRAMDAPAVEVDDVLRAQDERRLLEHYGGAAATTAAVAAPSLWQRFPMTTSPRR